MFGVMRIVNVSHGDLVILLSLIGNFAGLGLRTWSFTVMAALVPLAVAMGWLLQRAVLNRVVGEGPAAVADCDLRPVAGAAEPDAADMVGKQPLIAGRRD